MTSPGDSYSFFVRFAALAAMALAGCEQGGQSSDDGTPSDGGPPILDAATEDAGREGSWTIGVEFPLEGQVVPGCAAGIDDALFEESPVQAVLEAEHHCKGYESAGSFQCVCDGEAVVSYAVSCVGALLDACGVQAEPLGGPAGPLTDCATTLEGRAGRCEASDGGYDCRCESDHSNKKVDSVTCEQALFEACGEQCDDPFGACAPATTSPSRLGHYECTCTTHGLTRVVGARTCGDALAQGCATLSTYADGCSGYGGYCEIASDDETSLACTCADGREETADYVPYTAYPREHPCRDSLEMICGLGDPPDGALCMSEANDYAARCTRAPASDAPLRCECGFRTDVLLTAREAGPFEDMACEDALDESCPELQPITEADREATCDHYAACDTPVGFSRESCEGDVGDGCVACTRFELARLGDIEGCPDERLPCRDACASLVPKEVAVAQCEALAEQRGGALDDGAACLCDACHPAAGECLADELCAELLACAIERDCEMAECQTDPVCGPLVMQIAGTPAFSRIVRLTQCPERLTCRQ